MMRSPLLAALLALAPAARAYDHIKFLEPLKGPDLVRPIAAASSGSRLYVIDEKKGALLVFDASGALVKTAAVSGDKPGALRDPRGLAVGPSGKVYVADTGNHRVQIFDADGGFVYAFGEKGSEPGTATTSRWTPTASCTCWPAATARSSRSRPRACPSASSAPTAPASAR
ncbi:MAG: NHL repeat-containing protein [Elusimicrobia bacterium]|nr:NHL repeat-containing protein [Elusimicrobiota bacterium]